MRHTAYGKWILAGEHAVLRGFPALVFPLKNKKMEFDYQPADQDLSVRFGGDHGHELELIFHGVLEKALLRLEKKRSDFSGHLFIESSLPLGAGMGGSAALCVGVARLMAAKGWIEEESIFKFARDLEDLFHGESSGVDIAVSLAGEPIQFQRNLEAGRSAAFREPLDLAWVPQLYLSYCGKKGVTSECVKRVRALREHSEKRAHEIDERMAAAVFAARSALREAPSIGSFEKLKEALNKARTCFEDWGLLSPELSNHIRELERAGAEGVKPTGSGGGGYVLSLWRQAPPESLSSQLIAVL